MDYDKLFDDIQEIARTTDWVQDEPTEAELSKQVNGMWYNLEFWLMKSGFVTCEMRWGIDEPGCDPWRGETVLGSDALEAFQKSIKANSYLLRG